VHIWINIWVVLCCRLDDGFGMDEPVDEAMGVSQQRCSLAAQETATDQTYSP
jgi:hypothetical protein